MMNMIFLRKNTITVWLFKIKALYLGKKNKQSMTENNLRNIEEIKMRLKKIDTIEVVSSNHNNFEIMNKGVSKGKAVETLAKEYGILKDEVIAIGDGENDLSMISYAGLGVAMGNSSDYIKEHADYVTDTNVNGGVGKVIKKFVLNK